MAARRVQSSARSAFPLLTFTAAASCGGGTVLGNSPPDASATTDGATDIGDSQPVATACVPGRSVGCTGPGGCSSNQVCNGAGTAFGPCDCAPGGDAAPGVDATTKACVPGQSIACAGPGGCIANQVCNADGSAYGPCACAGDGGVLCVPGQSIQCAGPSGCVSYQVCDATGKAYAPCVCAEGGSYYDGGVPDGWAPLPPLVGNQGYSAFWAYDSNWSANAIYLPLFSAPDCAVVPPYGEYYFVIFEPSTTGPAGTFPSCPSLGMGGPSACYSPARTSAARGQDFVGGGANFTYTLSAFDANGIATGQMNTTDGIVPLVVKNCP